jgi:ribosome-associated protein YbcJ (S4-like RNA binding protein)
VSSEYATEPIELQEFLNLVQQHNVAGDAKVYVQVTDSTGEDEEISVTGVELRIHDGGLAQVVLHTHD